MHLLQLPTATTVFTNQAYTCRREKHSQSDVENQRFVTA